MPFSTFILPVFSGALLMVTCYFLGRFGYSFLWILLFMGLNFMKKKMWKAREKRLLALRQTSTREKEVIMAQLTDLPAWVNFPDTERVEWANKVIHQLWPYISEYAKVFLKEVIEPKVRTQMPTPLKSFKFLQMDMGDIPCRVGGIKVYTSNVGRDRIIIDADVAYSGDCNFVVGVGIMKGGLNEMLFSGKLRAILKPLLPYPPMVGGISAFFLENPKIDFNLTGIGEFVEIPGLMSAIRAIIITQVADICVLPNKIVIPLAPNVDVTKLFFPEPDGIIRINIVEARNLENQDFSVFKKDKSDPYAEIQCGVQYFKTRTIENDLNPKFDEYFEAIVDEADGQKLRVELFDYDITGKDEELGRLTLNLDKIRTSGTVDQWYPLEGCKHGDLHCKFYWMNLTTNVNDLKRQQWEMKWLNVDKPIHSALLMVFIDNASDLPYPKAKLEPSPYIEITLGLETKKTPTKCKTVNPLFQSRFAFFVRNPEGQELIFQARDEGTKRNLGNFILPLDKLLTEPNMEFYQRTFPLTHGVKQSPFVATVRLRTLRLGAESNDFPCTNEADVNAPILSADGKNTKSVAKTSNFLPTEEAKLPPNHFESAPNPENVLKQELELESSSLSIDDQKNSPSRGIISRLTKGKHHMTKSKQSCSASKRGRLRLGLRYNFQDNRLVVNVGKIQNLVSVDGNGSADPYISVKLLSIDGSSKTKQKTATIMNTLNPIFNECFDFDLHSSDLHNYKLIFMVKDSANFGLFAKKPVLGQIIFKLSHFETNTQLVDEWVDLEPEE